jgi:2-amino-4-hydroxy-6-hydroxymethyldihydropteridine diphosphokinase
MSTVNHSSATRAYLALGSNLGDRAAHLIAARTAVARTPGCTLKASSSLYETAAWGATEPQPDYLNAVIAIDTLLPPAPLRIAMARIEQAHGRVRTATQNAARTLDIDVLLFGAKVLNTPDLVVPHPRMHLRNFVLLPLLEIAPDIVVPDRGSATTLLNHATDQAPCSVFAHPQWN